MRLRALAREGALLAMLGFEVVWLVLGVQLLGVQHRGGIATWLLLCGAGAAMLLFNRWLRQSGRWSSGQGRALSLGMALALTSLLMKALAPQLVGGWLGGPLEFAAALSAVWRFSDSFPLTVVALAGLILWSRALRLGEGDSGPSTVNGRFRRSALLLVVLLVVGTYEGLYRAPGGLAFLFAGCALLASALARLRAALADPTIPTTVRFNERAVTTLLGGTAGTLAIALATTLLFSQRGMAWLGHLLAPLGVAAGALFALLAHALAALLLPLIQAFFGSLRVSEEPLPPPAPPLAATPVVGGEAIPSGLLVGAGPSPFVIVFIVALLGLVALLLRRYFAPPRPALEGLQHEAHFERSQGGSGGLAEWLRRQGDGLRQRMERRPRRPFGVDDVRDLYRNLLLFGDEHGVPRPPDETPYEYLYPLVTRYPARRDDLHALTDAYVALRYGERPVSPDDLQQLRAAWQRIALEAEAR